MGLGSVTRGEVVHKAGDDVDFIYGQAALFVDRLATVPGGTKRLEPRECVVEVGCLVHERSLGRGHRFAKGASGAFRSSRLATLGLFSQFVEAFG